MDKDDSVQTISSAESDDVFRLLSWFRSERVKQANVMVVGCGALGNEVLKNLALFGLEHLVIVDFDSVESSNLTRSVLFRQADAEQSRMKALVAAERLRDINSALNVLPLLGDITHDVGLGLLRRMDVVVCCVDNRWARYCLNRLCMRAGVPWVDGGIDGLEGTARVFIPGKNCYACNLGPEALRDLSFRLSCSSVVKRNEQAGRVPTTPVVASVIGAVEAQEAVKLLHPEELDQGTLTSLCGKMFYYEGQYLASRIVDFVGYDADCPVHESWVPVSPVPLSTRMRVDEALDCLSEQHSCREVEILLPDHSFVDYLLTREEERKFSVMVPDYEVERFVELHPVLRYMPFHQLYQHEWKSLDRRFPYPSLTLREIGIPEWDILPVKTEAGRSYVELVDELNYARVLSKTDEV